MFNQFSHSNSAPTVRTCYITIYKYKQKVGAWNKIQGKQKALSLRCDVGFLQLHND